MIYCWIRYVISNSNIINLISKIHEYKGEQPYLLETQKDTLESLTDIAKIESTSSSNKIEGIYTTDKRINEIVIKNLEKKTQNLINKYNIASSEILNNFSLHTRIYNK